MSYTGFRTLLFSDHTSDTVYCDAGSMLLYQLDLWEQFSNKIAIHPKFIWYIYHF